MTCECGSERSRGAKACARCSELDGRTKAAGAVIASLRVAGTASIPDICREAGMSNGAANAAVKRLLRGGRVRKIGGNPARWSLIEPRRTA